jgi:hypothetical protein
MRERLPGDGESALFNVDLATGMARVDICDNRAMLRAYLDELVPRREESPATRAWEWSLARVNRVPLAADPPTQDVSRTALPRHGCCTAAPGLRAPGSWCADGDS